MTDREHRIDTGSPEERVKRIYPDAYCWNYPIKGGYVIENYFDWCPAAGDFSRGVTAISGEKKTEAEAWADVSPMDVSAPESCASSAITEFVCSARDALSGKYARTVRIEEDDQIVIFRERCLNVPA